METLSWTGIISLEFDEEEHQANGMAGVLMSEEDIDDLESSFIGFLGDELSGEMEITCVTVQAQEYDRPCVGAVILERRLFGPSDNSAFFRTDFELDYRLHQIFFKDSTTHATSMQQSIRKLARDQTITALDLTVQICAQYIPALDANNKITQADLENNIIRIIADKEQGAVNAISSTSTFFHALAGITAISTDMLLDPPSSSPSVSPTRSEYQSIETYIDANPYGGYGIFFSMQTHADVSTILLTGMTFVTPHDGMVEYQVYSRLGDYRGYQGFVIEWDLIASGKTVASGPGTFTRVLNDVPEEEDSGHVGFTPIHVPGNLGIRSFYVTMTKAFNLTDGNPVPLSFSASSVAENEGSSNYAVIVSNEELEIFEGDAVMGRFYRLLISVAFSNQRAHHSCPNRSISMCSSLASSEYPAPQIRDGLSEYYKRPRGFLGSFEYTKEACYPTVGESCLSDISGALFTNHHFLFRLFWTRFFRLALSSYSSRPIAYQTSYQTASSFARITDISYLEISHKSYMEECYKCVDKFRPGKWK